MKTIPTNLILEKNLLSQTNEWLWLIDLYYIDDDSTPLRIVKNNEDIVYGGNTYTAFPFDIEGTKQSSKGEIPTVKLSVGNVTRVIQAYVEDYSGLVGKTVCLHLVNVGHLTEDYTEFEQYFEILSCSSNENWIIFELGSPNPIRRRFPLHRYLADYCPWAGYFMAASVAVECGYPVAGSGFTSCDGTLQTCKARGNSSRFGGFPGLGRGGIKFK